jgi:hypothetical protein
LLVHGQAQRLVELGAPVLGQQIKNFKGALQ